MLQISKQTLIWRGKRSGVQKVRLMLYSGAWGWEFRSPENNFWESSLKLPLKACSASGLGNGSISLGGNV